MKQAERKESLEQKLQNLKESCPLEFQKMVPDPKGLGGIEFVYRDTVITKEENIVHSFALSTPEYENVGYSYRPYATDEGIEWGQVVSRTDMKESNLLIYARAWGEEENLWIENYADQVFGPSNSKIRTAIEQNTYVLYLSLNEITTYVPEEVVQ